MKKHIFKIIILLCCTSMGCKKDFLDAKPRKNLLVPTTLADFTSILNSELLNYTSALGQMAADEYVFPNEVIWNAAQTATERNSYIWNRDIFEGEIERRDWNQPYRTVFYANAVIEGLEGFQGKRDAAYNEIRGWALFVRAYAYYDLARTFAKSYNEASAAEDLGIPLRLSAAVDQVLPRASVKATYDQILRDLEQSSELLPVTFPQFNRNKPFKGSAHAMLARVYLSMNKFVEAELHTDKALAIYDKLIDYNTISANATSPFTNTNDETLFSTAQVATYLITTNVNANPTEVNPELLGLYHANDQRLSVLFGRKANGAPFFKRGYLGSGNYPFSGLAVNELYLIKAECLARRNLVAEAMQMLNKLLVKRWNPNATVPARPYVSLTSIDRADAITKVLLERRKELVWRGMRWSDIKRLNMIGANITLQRNLGGKIYTLPPNDARYVLPIPDDEIARSGLVQNVR